MFTRGGVKATPSGFAAVGGSDVADDDDGSAAILAGGASTA